MSTANIHDAVATLLQEYAPKSLVLAGQLAQALAEPWLQSNPQCRVTCLAPQTDDAGANTLPSADLRADFAIVGHAGGDFTENLDDRLLARLRDLTVSQFAVITSVPAASGWARNDLAAFALDHLGRFHTDTGETASVDLYCYDIRHYKQTPDWLNADFWANPNRWNKERW